MSPKPTSTCSANIARAGRCKNQPVVSERKTHHKSKQATRANNDGVRLTLDFAAFVAFVMSWVMTRRKPPELFSVETCHFHLIVFRMFE